jgi:hypothetical protein
MEDGVIKDIEVHTLRLDDARVYGLVWQMASFEPMVYARQGDGRAVMGMLSPNFDGDGADRLHSIKVLPLQRPRPLVRRGTDLVPHAETATMLAGSAHAEGKGVGGHDVAPAHDYEHKTGFLGAVSLGRQTVVDGTGRHVQHAVRERSSVATGLTNGQLGNLFVPNGADTGGFSGYAMPLFFSQDTVGPSDTIYWPKDFLNRDEAYGVHYDEAARITYGAGLKILHARLGEADANSRLARMAGETV